jgi:phage N-6-adenine-methyltransferase
MSLKSFDDTGTTIEEDDDDYETPDQLFFSLCEKYDILPQLDACALSHNKKCQNYLTNALYDEWLLHGKRVDVWCNPPGSMQLSFIERAELQYLKHNFNIIMIVPANCVSTEIFHKYIEGKREYHAVQGRPIFLKNGKKTRFPSRNSYICIIWRKTIPNLEEDLNHK